MTLWVSVLTEYRGLLKLKSLKYAYTKNIYLQIHDEVCLIMNIPPYLNS